MRVVAQAMAGASFELATRVGPLLAKSWLTHAAWCYREGRKQMEETDGSRALRFAESEVGALREVVAANLEDADVDAAVGAVLEVFRDSGRWSAHEGPSLPHNRSLSPIYAENISDFVTLFALVRAYYTRFSRITRNKVRVE